MRAHDVAAILAASLFLAGCTTEAVIADLEEDKVIVQATGFDDDMSVVWAEARKGCAIHDRVPVEVSYTCIDDCLTKEYLFACVDP